MKSAYDAIVVGAGPSGSVAATRLAQGGLRVLMIEKRQEIGAPVRCAEAVGEVMTSEHIPIRPHWINARITQYAIKSESGASVTVPPTEPTLVVDRKVFDWELAHQAANTGVDVRTRTQAEGLLKNEDGRVIGVRMNSMGKSYHANAPLIIAADGVESQAARWAGLKTVPPMSDFYVGFQYLLGNVGHYLTPHTCEYHIGHRMAPGGYLWVFPKGEDTANVGLVISADNAAEVSARDYLDRFVARLFPNASILGAQAGGIPATGALRKMVTDGVMAVGDAAHQADPLTAGGINLGMVGGDLAAQVGLKAHRMGDFSARFLSEYERMWHERFGKQHAALYQVRKMLTRMDDDRIGALIQTASSLPLDTMSQGQVLLALFRHHPRLLIEAQVLIATGLVLK